MGDNDRIGVGLIGANPDKGWGGAVHVPAIGFVEGLDLVAIATTREESARRGAAAFGVRHAFADPQALVSHPDVDLVAIAVKAPDHHALAMMALAAGKHVYCEWPLAANAAQAAEMVALAAQKGVHAMVGLQARAAPAIRRMRDLVGEGYVGRLVAVRLACALPGGGGRRSREGLYVIDRKNGASTLAIQGGHAIDALRFCVGGFIDLSAVVANQFETIEVIETGERMAKDAPDQILASGRLENGGVVSIAINGGVVAGHGIALDIFGDEGTLSIGWPGPLNFQMSELVLSGARLPQRSVMPLDIPDGYDPGIVPHDFTGRQPYPGVDVPRATVVNVANLYRDLAVAIRTGERAGPDFATGLALHHLLDGIERSSNEGRVPHGGGDRLNPRSYEIASFYGQ